MVNQIFVILFLHKIILIEASASLEKYFVQNDISVNLTSINSSWSVGYYTFKSKIICLAECNSITSCYSVVYNEDSTLTTNCALYSKYFKANELISMKSSYFYSKECKKFYFNLTNGYILI